VIPPRLLRAFRATAYRVGGETVRIGRRGPVQGVFVTAQNPFARRRPDGWNRRMQRALAAHARRMPAQEARGEGRGWSEDHLVLTTDPRRVEVLARRFRQLAIMVAAPGRPARLVAVRR
jgi:hypothetical protein